MFNGATAFNQPIGNWPLSASSIDMQWMFRVAAFNQDLSNWDVSRVTSFSTTFQQSSFNNSGSTGINNWQINTGSNVSFFQMFYQCPFNQPIGSWNVTKVTSMGGMFGNNGAFNQPIGTWTPVSCSDFSRMFSSAGAFNQPVESWTLPTDRTYTMQDMFSGATSFNQPLGNWNIVSCSNMSGMLNSCGMDINNYSNTLIGWASQPDPLIPRNITLGATGRQYNTPGSASRAILTSAPYNWTITGDTFVP
jgi:hypothetical protein